MCWHDRGAEGEKEERMRSIDGKNMWSWETWVEPSLRLSSALLQLMRLTDTPTTWKGAGIFTEKIIEDTFHLEMEIPTLCWYTSTWTISGKICMGPLCCLNYFLHFAQVWTHLLLKFPQRKSRFSNHLRGLMWANVSFRGKMRYSEPLRL